MCNFSSQNNLILGRIKLEWIENCLNDLNIEDFVIGNRENREETPKFRVPSTYRRRGRVTLGLFYGAGCVTGFSHMHGFKSVLEKHLIFLVKLII